MNQEIKVLNVYRNYTYFITNCFGCWYCAYVILPEDHKYYGMHYDDIPIKVHGGLTFANNHKLVDGKWCIGWDYAHYDDYNYNFFPHGHKWTIDEIISECKNVID